MFVKKQKISTENNKNNKLLFSLYIILYIIILFVFSTDIIQLADFEFYNAFYFQQYFNNGEYNKAYKANKATNT